MQTFCVVAFLSMNCHAANKPLNFNFLKSPPGKRVFVDPHYLHIDCRGSGDATVLFEAGLGGSALEWGPVVDSLGSSISTCVYDRAGYGWSDPPSFTAHVTGLALDANRLLDAAGIYGPMILVGHSFGGFVVRSLADLRKDDVIGMVLIDASHEDQFMRFEELGGAPLVPRGKKFVMRATGAPENLPIELSEQIDAINRLRKTYDATHNEMTNFRLSAEQVKRNRTVFPFPVKVLSRGITPYANDDVGIKKTAIWNELQEELTNISSQGELIIAAKSGHHIHIDEPELIMQAITELLYDYKQSQN